MKFIIQDDKRRNEAIRFLNEMDVFKPIEVHIKPYKKNRTKSQNDTMWMWYEEIGKFMGHTPEELHRLMKVRVLGIDETVIDGQLLREPKSTTKLTTKGMADFMRSIEMLAGELNVIIPYPDDYRDSV